MAPRERSPSVGADRSREVGRKGRAREPLEKGCDLRRPRPALGETAPTHFQQDPRSRLELVWPWYVSLPSFPVPRYSSSAPIAISLSGPRKGRVKGRGSRHSCRRQLPPHRERGQSRSSGTSSKRVFRGCRQAGVGSRSHLVGDVSLETIDDLSQTRREFWIPGTALHARTKGRSMRKRIHLCLDIETALWYRLTILW